MAVEMIQLKKTLSTITSANSNVTWTITVTQTKNNLFLVVSYGFEGQVFVVKQVSFRACCKTMKGVLNPDKLKLFCEDALEAIEESQLPVTRLLFVDCAEVTWPLSKIFIDNGITPTFITHRAKIAHNGCKKKKQRHNA